MLLTRFCYSDQGTFGRLTLPDGQWLATVERPWLNNAAGLSCIPVGEYDCEPRRFNRGGYDAVEVIEVPHRSHILFHIGNKPSDSLGCILINSSHGCLGGQWAGLSSKPAFQVFMDAVDRQPFKLKIVNFIGGV